MDAGGRLHGPSRLVARSIFRPDFHRPIDLTSNTRRGPAKLRRGRCHSQVVGSEMTVTTEALATTDLGFARQLGQQLRVDSIRSSTAAGSGHPTSSMSSADLIAALITRPLHY